MSNGNTFVAENGEVYIDKKRYAWLFSFLIPATNIAGPLSFMQSGNELHLWLFIIFWYAISPNWIST